MSTSAPEKRFTKPYIIEATNGYIPLGENLNVVLPAYVSQQGQKVRFILTFEDELMGVTTDDIPVITNQDTRATFPAGEASPNKPFVPGSIVKVITYFTGGPSWNRGQDSDLYIFR